jgi:acyl transferase domain-containing protein/NAD(P)H-dependent flavin oxidoreductase YrpB (nitropropane dioxygenase family)/NAD(P)-dependent dehydrogenase (short-subunit alcohol dehydrogenase family)
MIQRVHGRCIDFFVYSPAALAHPGLALAAARAGAVGVLDFEFVRDLDIGRARENLARLEHLIVDTRFAGVRLDARHADQPVPTGWTVVVALAPLYEQLAVARACAGRRLIFEAADLARLDDLHAAGINPDALVACGSESGGWISTSSAFILAQKFAGGSVPLFVRGASGPRAAAACRAIGCDGVVLTSEVLLTADSPLSGPVRQIVEKLDFGDTVMLGERIAVPIRLAHRGASAPLRQLQDLALHLEADAADDPDIHRKWREAVYAAVAWGDPSVVILPIGSGIGLAARYAARYGTVGVLLKEWRRDIAASLSADAAPFAPRTPLAQSQKTEYPIVQGPMTRVSDNAAFARAVADGGALPMLALALLRGDALAALLDTVKRSLAGRSWGVGILGFVPAEIRAEQIEAIIHCRPPFALIAGGRPDQVQQLEAHGIPTYLHVPSPSLVAPFVEAGARRFVFEGGESGGHVGPLGAAVLWESCVDALLDAVPPDQRSHVHVLFAGGIHDAKSAAMASLFAAPLAHQGFRVGVLMGTAYLFTAEVVGTGAIVPQYQDQTVACRQTVTLESGPAHANRCAVTPFASEFAARRRSLLRERTAPQEMKDDLDRLGLGRLRLATKGKKREGGSIVDADAETQARDGMYMMGEVATLRDGVTTIAELHRAVAVDATAFLGRSQAVHADPAAAAQPSDIAIVGMATLLPGADDCEAFWDNVLQARCAIGEVPADRWDWRLLFDADKSAPDRSYSKWGGFFNDVVFDPLRFGIPPNFVRNIGVAQLLALEMVHRALVDSGYDRRPFDRERVAVIVAEVDHGGMLHHQHIVRTILPFILGTQPSQMVDRLAEWNEDSFPGSLSNITAGRVANRFDFGGPNFAVDAACASSLTALDLAVQELAAGRSDMAIVGGIDTGQHPYAYVAFSKTQALSPTGKSRPFDKNADGIVISEGLAVVVLKRLRDAERDGDNIYAVIKAVAGSSDGKAMSLTAPHPAGQLRALRRAYARADIAPSQIGYYEAHGTGTAVGDRAEAQTIKSLLGGDASGPDRCAIGSVKALIGHTKAAAGLVSLAKTALALRHRVIPPHRIETPLDEIGAPSSPIYACDQARPWLVARGGLPRRAGVSAFGFGGTNSHAVLEEYLGHAAMPAPGADRWPSELFVARATTKDGLLAGVRHVLTELKAGARPSLRDLAFTFAVRAPAEGDWSAAFVADSLDDVAKKLAALENAIEGNSSAQRGIVLRRGTRIGGAAALLFPGQGSQYPGMAREAALYLQEARAVIESADAVLRDPLGTGVSAVIDPLGGSTELTDTSFVQPAVGVAAVALASLLERLGIQIDMTAGHSYGEYVALYAAGALPYQDLLLLSALRGRVMRGDGGDMGTMIAVAAEMDWIRSLIVNTPGIVIANRNSPKQTVLSGTREAVTAIAALLDRNGVSHVALPVSGAFHSPLMAPAQAPLAAAIARTPFVAPRIPVYGNAAGDVYPAETTGIRARLTRHLLEPVDFIDLIERMYCDGARLFIESGPSDLLTKMVGDILGDRPHLAVSLDRRGGRLADQLDAIGSIWASGHAGSVELLFTGRRCCALDLNCLAATTSPPALPVHALLVNGMWARLPGQAGSLGRTRLRDADSPIDTLEKGVVAMTQSPDEPQQPPGTRVFDAYQETMRQFLKTQEEALRMFFDAQPAALTAPLVALPQEQRAPEQRSPEQKPQAPRSQEVPPRAAATPARTTAPPHLGAERQGTGAAGETRQAISAALVQVIADVTGYPLAMIDVGGDLEGDLGVDSIRRLQIFQKFQRSLPVKLAESAKASAEQIARARSVRAILDILFAGMAPESISVSPAVAAPKLQSREDAPPAAQDCPRFVMRAVARPLGTTGRRLEGTFLVTGEESPILPHVVTHLRARGVRAHVLTNADCASRERLLSCLTSLTVEDQFTGVIHLVPSIAAPFPADYGKWRQGTELDTKAFFHILKFAASRGCDLRWVAGISGFGGAFGRDGSAVRVAPSSGAAVGLLKTFQIEHPGAVVKALDFDPTRAPAEIGAQIVEELAGGDPDCEIGFIDGRRSVFTAVEAPLTDPAAEDSRENWIVLVTGGARGITAQVARALAARGQTMIVVGRSRLAGKEDPSLVGLETVDMLRNHLVEKAMHSGTKVTPAQIDGELSELLRDREIRHNLNALRGAGIDVRYEALDVRSPDGFAKLITDTYRRYSRIDAVIHGAGVIADKLLAEKSPDVFEQVFDTKVDSTYLLFRHLKPQSLRLMMLFASTAGRFGNRGQSDYAAANEVINRFAWRMKQEWPSTRVTSINWGPWLGGGMASEPVNEAFRARGVRPIDPRAGVEFALREIASSSGDVEVIAGDGPWRGASSPPTRHAVGLPET